MKLIEMHVQQIVDCNIAINAVANLLLDFQVDSECENQIPESIKNGRICEALLMSVMFAANASDRAAEFIQERMAQIRLEDHEQLDSSADDQQAKPTGIKNPEL